MSRFSGRQARGALREHQKTLAMGAFVRAFNRLNPGDMDFGKWKNRVVREYLGPEPQKHLPQGIILDDLIEELVEMLVEASPEGKLLRQIFTSTDEHPGTGQPIEDAVKTL